MAEPSLINLTDSGSITSDLSNTNSPASDESKTGVTLPLQSNYFRQKYFNNNTVTSDAFNYFAVTPSLTRPQLLLLVSNDLQQKRFNNQIIDQRLIKDEKEFQHIETILNTKIRKYQHFIKRKLQNADCIENINFDHMDDLLDEIIQVDETCIKLNKEIRKKQEDENQNEIYKMIGLNNDLLNNIDAITQKIDYWQQMLLVTSQKSHSPEPPINNNDDNNVAPYAIEDVLKIKSKNKKILNDLRSQLINIRANNSNV